MLLLAWTSIEFGGERIVKIKMNIERNKMWIHIRQKCIIFAPFILPFPLRRAEHC